MSAVGRRMDINGDFTSRAPSTSTSHSQSHSRVSSTSGDGEQNSNRAALNLNAKRKPRRKTITLSELSRTANANADANANANAAYRDAGGAQSVSESAFGSPPCSPLRLPPLQTSGFSFNASSTANVVAAAGVTETVETTTPRRMSSRIAALSTSYTATAATSNLDANTSSNTIILNSPVKTRSLTTSASGGNLKSSSITSQSKNLSNNHIQKRPSVIRETSVVSISSEGGRYGGRGIPRTSTLPTHFTDSLMKMKISREDTSVESLTLNTPTGVPNLDPNDPNGAVDGGDGMDIDDGPSQAEMTSVAISTAPRKGRTRRRARSLPPTPVLVPVEPEENENDADDEGEGTSGTPVIAPSMSSPRKRRGRAGPASILGERADTSRAGPRSNARTGLGVEAPAGVGVGGVGIGGGAARLGDHVIMPGIEATDSPSILRRSARHVRTRDRGQIHIGIGDSGGSQEVRDMEDITPFGEGVGLGGGITRKRARTREDYDGERGDSRDRREMVVGDQLERERDRDRDGEEDDFLGGRVLKRLRRR